MNENKALDLQRLNDDADDNIWERLALLTLFNLFCRDDPEKPE